MQGGLQLRVGGWEGGDGGWGGEEKRRVDMGVGAREGLEVDDYALTSQCDSVI